jgi:hypothetical protein
MASTNTCTNRPRRDHAIISQKVSQYETHVYGRYQRTQSTMISTSNCRPLNSAGRFRLIQAEAYQTSRTPLQPNRFQTHPLRTA